MTSDTLLQALGKLAREEDQAVNGDSRYDQLLNGELSVQQQAALEQESSSSAASAAAFAACKPRDLELQARIEQLAEAELFPQARVHKANDANKVTKIFPRRVYKSLAVIAPIVAAAALLVLFLRPQPVDGLPTYTLVLNAGTQHSRLMPQGEAPAPPVFDRDTTLTALLRPSRPTSTSIAVRGFVMSRDGRRFPIPIESRVSKEGAVQIQGNSADLFARISAGTWDFVVLVGPSDAISRVDDSTTLDSVPTAIQVHRQTITVQ